ncbi:MAG: hypothetical protein GWN01_05505 [Nitrosopumilaceae archaeon]|nr:hypothetical protein [Nitrosopumilaceae archaeon]NIU86802.1 hypothetical protein [Nitrosopumilaceae archaeon]NIX61001.1 hypothetical protein [Nitrosopumilaceae archaeon]
MRYIDATITIGMVFAFILGFALGVNSANAEHYHGHKELKRYVNIHLEDPRPIGEEATVLIYAYEVHYNFDYIDNAIVTVNVTRSNQSIDFMNTTTNKYGYAGIPIPLTDGKYTEGIYNVHITVDDMEFDERLWVYEKNFGRDSTDEPKDKGKSKGKKPTLKFGDKP